VLASSGFVLQLGVSFILMIDLFDFSFRSLSWIRLLLDLYLLLPVEMFDFKDCRLVAKLCLSWSTLFPPLVPLRVTLML
jgi:hypothetical protein